MATPETGKGCGCEGCFLFLMLIVLLAAGLFLVFVSYPTFLERHDTADAYYALILGLIVSLGTLTWIFKFIFKPDEL
jgi:hypothetical protein